MEPLCGVCDGKFSRKSCGRYNRYSLKSLASPYTSTKVFGDIDKSTYLCVDCIQLLKQKTFSARGNKRRWHGPRTPRRLNAHQSGPSPKRCDLKETPDPKETGRRLEGDLKETPDPKAVHSAFHRLGRFLEYSSDDSDVDVAGEETSPKSLPAFKRTTIKYIKGSHYEKAIKLLWSESSVAKQAIVSVAIGQIQSEIRAATKKRAKKENQIDSFKENLTLETLEQFSWTSLVEKCQEKLPILTNFLDAMLPTASVFCKGRIVGPKGGKRNMSVGEGNNIKLARLGVIMSTILHSHAPRKYNLLQQAFAVHLWRQGATHKLYKTLGRLGITLTPKSARKLVDKLTDDHDKTVQLWQNQTENHFQPPALVPDEQPQPVIRRRLCYNNAPDMPQLSFSLGWDNVQKNVQRKHQTRDQGNQMLSLALAYAVGHRIPSLHLATDTIPASDIPLINFLPSPSDWNLVKERMNVLVMRILVNIVPALEQLQTSVTKHIPHEHSKELCKQSVVINLGTIDENPASTAGAIEIMSHLQKYIPRKPDGTLIPIIINGDQMSVERMTHAKRGRIRGPVDEDRLEGLVESIQDFHKEGIILQDTMDEFFTQRSIADRGTLYHLKEFFNHRSLKHRVMENFQHVWDFLEFVTEGLVILLFMKFAGMKKLKDEPESLRGSKEQKEKWLKNMACRVVDFVFQPYSQEDVNRITDPTNRTDRLEGEPDISPFCICREEKGGNMTQCCSSLCENQWIHWECANPPLDHEPEGHWFCSDECRNGPGLIYCICQTKQGHKDTQMIQCAAQGECKRRQFYHKKCLALDDSLNLDAWFCSEECETQEETDHILSHSRNLLWRGLLHLANRDVTREGDGPMMILFWKIHLPEFWQRKHPKYVIAAHLLLANIYGFQSERVAHELVWERVANLTGQPGKNISLDLANELLNNEFKELLSHSRGNYTPAEINRCSKMGGAFGQQFESIFKLAMGMKDHVTHHKRAQHYETDIKKFVKSFKKDKLFDNQPGREHAGFTGYDHDPREIKNPVKLGVHLSKLSSSLDFWQRRAQHPREDIQDEDA